MKTRSVASVVLVAILSSSVSLPALADDDPATTQARARFKEGVDYFDKGQFENARLAFQQAYMLKKHPAVLLNLAQSSAKGNHPLEAAKAFQQFLKESTTATPQQRRDAEKGLADVRQKLGLVDVLGPAGIEITLDDKEKLGTTPISDPIDVEPGSHTFKSPAESLHVTVSAGQRMQVKFGDRPAPVAATPPPAAPSEASAEPYGEPAASTSEPVSTNETEVKKPGLFSPPKSMTPVWAGIAVGGVGLVGTILFAVFKSDAQSKADQVAEQIRSAASRDGYATAGLCNQTPPTDSYANACATLRENNDKVDTNATLANVSVGVMAAGFLFAGGWYLFAPKRDAAKTEDAPAPAQETSFRVMPYGGYGNAGLNVVGTF